MSFLISCIIVGAKLHNLPYIHECVYSPTVFYLVAWMEEEALSIVPSKAIVTNSECLLLPGSLCQVRVRGRLYEAKVVTSGMWLLLQCVVLVKAALPCLSYEFNIHSCRHEAANGNLNLVVARRRFPA